jgi:cytochrome b561
MSATTHESGSTDRPARYAASLRVLHWLMAALVVVMFVLGLWIRYFEPKTPALDHRLYNLHESTGVTIFALLLLRVILRLTNPAPKLAPRTPGWVRGLATVNQAALYVLLFAMPIIGFLDANAWGAPLTWFEAVPIPSPIGRQPEAIAQQIANFHWWGAVVLFVLIALHFAGAAYHGLVRRDATLRHML